MVMNKIKSFFSKCKGKVIAGALACAALVSAGVARAEDSATAIDVTPVTTQLTRLQTGVQSFWESAFPILGIILGLALLVTLFFVAYKLVTRGTRKAG
jgi:hypothetical protein